MRMPLNDQELARREEGRILLRPSPLRMRWLWNDLATADGHTLSCTWTCSVRTLDESVERQMLAEAFLSNKNALTCEDVTAYFAPALRAAAAKTALSQNAAQWLGDNAGNPLQQALQAAAQKTAFACGLEVLAPFHLDIESPSFEQQKIEAMEQNLAQRRAAGQVEHFQRAAELLKQFQAMRESSPNLTPSAVLEQLGPSQQGMMLQTLLLASAKQKAGQSLWAVAGSNLVRIDARNTPPRIDLYPMPPAIGPLRSVQTGEIDSQPVLLVGR